MSSDTLEYFGWLGLVTVCLLAVWGIWILLTRARARQAPSGQPAGTATPGPVFLAEPEPPVQLQLGHQQQQAQSASPARPDPRGYPQPSAPREPDAPRDQLVRCPVCAEWIQPLAVKCRFCGEVLKPGGVHPWAPPVPRQPIRRVPAASVPSPEAPSIRWPAAPREPVPQPLAASGAVAPASTPAYPQTQQTAGLEARPTASLGEPPVPPVLQPSADLLQPSTAALEASVPEAAKPAPIPAPSIEAVSAPPQSVPVAEVAPVREPAPEPAELPVAPVQTVPVRSEVATGIEQMRHAPAGEHPPGFYEQVLAWLHDEDPRVREEAVRFLARHCRQHADAEHLTEMVVHDPDADVRLAAAECIGGVFRASRNREANEVLADVARNTEEEAVVRHSAYAAIKRINGY